MSDSTTGSIPAQVLYRTLWRWHFYAGLLCVPFVLALAVSGTIYLFKPQIDAFVDRPYHRLQVGSERISPNEQIEAAMSAVAGATFMRYEVPTSDAHAVVVSLTRDGDRTLVYVNPYTAEILRVVGYDDQFTRVVRAFHGELLAGNFGAVIVEVAGSWAIVMLITGLYLWWPRNARGLAGVLYPRLRGGGRVFWRDLHAVTGIWVTAFALFLLVTGLPWALLWGKALQEVRALNGPQQTQEWTITNAEQRAMRVRESAPSVDLPAAVVNAAAALEFAPPAELAPAGNGQWRLASDSQNRPLRAQAWLDGQTGAVLRVKPFTDQALLDRVIGVGIAAHEGQLFGWLNQALGLFTTLGLLTMSISALVLWRKRKPERALGAPALMESGHAGKIVATIVLCMAVLLPALALSLTLLLLLEWLVLRRLPSTRAWLGLRPVA